MKLYLRALGKLWLIPVFQIIAWLMLRDLPATSKGGYWHYFWPCWAWSMSIWFGFALVIWNVMRK